MKTFDSKMAFALCALMLITVAGGCSSGSFGDYEVRPASDLPDRFTWTGSETAWTGGCRSPIVDPRDGTRGLIVRSVTDQADYEVPSGRYGTSPGELLRIDCESGVAIGIVKR